MVYLFVLVFVLVFARLFVLSFVRSFVRLFVCLFFVFASVCLSVGLSVSLFYCLVCLIACVRVCKGAGASLAEPTRLTSDGSACFHVPTLSSGLFQESHHRRKQAAEIARAPSHRVDLRQVGN